MGAEVLLYGFEVGGDFGGDAWVEGLAEQGVVEPAGDAGAAYGGHFFGTDAVGVGVADGLQPGRDFLPVFADVEGQVVDGARETFEALRVLGIVEGGFGHGESLGSDSVLQLGYLGFAFEVVALNFGVLRL